jgi:hypothetical protein
MTATWTDTSPTARRASNWRLPGQRLRAPTRARMRSGAYFRISATRSPTSISLSNGWSPSVPTAFSHSFAPARQAERAVLPPGRVSARPAAIFPARMSTTSRAEKSDGSVSSSTARRPSERSACGSRRCRPEAVWLDQTKQRRSSASCARIPTVYPSAGRRASEQHPSPAPLIARSRWAPGVGPRSTSGGRGPAPIV